MSTEATCACCIFIPGNNRCFQPPYEQHSAPHLPILFLPHSNLWPSCHGHHPFRIRSSRVGKIFQQPTNGSNSMSMVPYRPRLHGAHIFLLKFILLISDEHGIHQIFIYCLVPHSGSLQWKEIRTSRLFKIHTETFQLIRWITFTGTVQFDTMFFRYHFPEL